MATAKEVLAPMELSARERKLIVNALGMALASRKRALNDPKVSDEMKVVVQVEMSDLTALSVRFL